jgi:hypothetical protein
MRILAAIFFCCVFPAAAAERSYEFPIDPNAKSFFGQPLYVDDATLKAAIPSLRAAGDRLSTCINSMFVPASGYIDFAPTVAGSLTHWAIAHRLLCSANKTTLTCTEPQKPWSVAFDDDPAQFFEVGAGVDLQDALSIDRAFRSGEVQYPPGLSRHKGLPLRRIKRDGSAYEVSFSDCGCNTRWSVELRRANRDAKVVAIKLLQDICV